MLPKYFRHSNLRSLVRQLNNYGFVSKPTRPSISQCFYHPLFARGKQGISDQIRRKAAVGAGAAEQPPSKRSNVQKGYDNNEDENYAAAVHANKLLTQRNLELQTRIRILEETMQQQQASYVSETPLSQYFVQQQLPRINSNGFLPSPIGSQFGSFFAGTQQPPSPSMAHLSKLVRSSGEMYSSFYSSNGNNIRAFNEDDDLLSFDIMRSLQCRTSMESLNE